MHKSQRYGKLRRLTPEEGWLDLA